MAGISTHILDTSLGRPAKGVTVSLEYKNLEGNWAKIAEENTNDDGRVAKFGVPPEAFVAGIYRLTFQLQGYFNTQGRKTFYPEAQICFCVDVASEHYHVPLLLNGFGYTTYRGS